MIVATRRCPEVKKLHARRRLDSCKETFGPKYFAKARYEWTVRCCEAARWDGGKSNRSGVLKYK